MSGEKLSSDEVPCKFAEWLLGMGCPPENVPSVEKLSEMCRGQYYMVWRSLMEHVEPKDKIKQKRLQVFCDDVQRWSKKSPFSKHNASAAMPEQLVLWQQHMELKEKVADAEERVISAREKLKLLADKISMQMLHRNISRRRVEDLQRRAWLLQQVAEDLKMKKQDLLETRSIADSLCSFDEEVDVQGTLEKYISVTCRQSTAENARPSASQSLVPAANSTAFSSVVSNVDTNEIEEHVSTLVRCRGDVLWPALQARRAALVPALATNNQTDTTTLGITSQSVLAHTAALHCNIGLEATKNRLQVKLTRKQLADKVEDLSNFLTGEACELLVLRCERARADARFGALRALLNDVTSRSGMFATEGPEPTDNAPTTRQITQIDKSIVSKREELKKVLINLSTTEKKIQNIRECLVHIFNGFHKDQLVQENERYKGLLDFPRESITTLRRFYEERREKRRNKMELSLNLDVSDNCSFTDPTDNDNSRFLDELRIYLKKFNLEKNRKLVLESGEKIWIFETLQSAVFRLHTSWQHQDLISPLICPSVCLSHNLQRLLCSVNSKEMMEKMLQDLDINRKMDFCIDISPYTREEGETRDKIKKRLNENLINLQKTIKNLKHGEENLKFWSDNQMRKYVSLNRTFNGKNYKDYEECHQFNNFVVVSKRKMNDY